MCGGHRRQDAGAALTIERGGATRIDRAGGGGQRGGGAGGCGIGFCAGGAERQGGLWRARYGSRWCCADDSGRIDRGGFEPVIVDIKTGGTGGEIGADGAILRGPARIGAASDAIAEIHVGRFVGGKAIETIAVEGLGIVGKLQCAGTGNAESKGDEGTREQGHDDIRRAGACSAGW